MPLVVSPAARARARPQTPLSLSLPLPLSLVVGVAVAAAALIPASRLLYAAVRWAQKRRRHGGAPPTLS